MPDGEWERYEAHVADCHVCTAKIEELGFVSDALLNAVPQLSAPPEIRSRVMAVVHAESELLNAAGAMADRPIVRRSPPRRFSLLRLRPWPATVLAASLLALGIGGGAAAHRRRGSGDPADALDRVRVGAGRRVLSAARLAATTPSSSSRGLSAPPEGRIYQVWLDRKTGTAPEPTEALFSVRKGRASVDVPGDLDGVKQVLVTDEPLGGSEVPTRPPVIAASMS